MVETIFNPLEILFWLTYGIISVVVMGVVSVFYYKIYNVVSELKHFSNEIATQIGKKFIVSLLIGFVIGIFVYKFFLLPMLYNSTQLQDNSFYLTATFVLVMAYLFPLYFVAESRNIKVDSYILAKVKENDFTGVVKEEIEKVKNIVEISGYGTSFLLGANLPIAVILGILAFLISTTPWNMFALKRNSS
ncbi:hypothetical protein [Desulfurobacterium sp.]|uniref:hypothetical protein n=1 Tax=Desulfurobacterium sp. TaxID=2004706 RepID=UPI00262125D5|nr:hypothetical protein [Desulfurobacterium sp.]